MMIGDRAKSPIFFAKYRLKSEKAITNCGIIISNEYDAWKVGGHKCLEKHGIRA